MEEETLRLAAHEAAEFVIYNFNKELSGGDAGHHLAAQSLLLHTRHELLHDLEVDIGFEQCAFHLAGCFGDIVLGELALTAQFFEKRFESAGEFFEHGILPPPGIRAL